MLRVNWQTCIDTLKDELPLQQFNTWIRPLKVESDHHSVTLVAPNITLGQAGYIGLGFAGRCHGVTFAALTLTHLGRYRSTPYAGNVG